MDEGRISKKEKRRQSQDSGSFLSSNQSDGASRKHDRQVCSAEFRRLIGSLATGQLQIRMALASL